MQDLSGKAKFTSDEISAMSSVLAKLQLPMPQFGQVSFNRNVIHVLWFR